MARQKWSTNLQEQIEQPCWPEGRRAGARSKKRSLRVVNEHFETIFNAAMAEKMLRAKLSSNIYYYSVKILAQNDTCISLI